MTSTAHQQRKTPYQEDTGGNRVIGSLAELIGTTPELRFSESDQTDPAGRYRFQGSGGFFYGQKALTALWATSENWLAVDAFEVLLAKSLADDTDIQFKVGVTNAKKVVVSIGAADSGLTQGFEVGTAQLQRLLIDMNGLAKFSYSIDLNSTGIQKVTTVKGDGVSNLNIKGNFAVTDATARRVSMMVLDPATDTEYTVAQAVPKAATPLFTMAAPDYVPTTSELDDGQVTFGYTTATDTLIMYVREGAAIKTLVLGTAV